MKRLTLIALLAVVISGCTSYSAKFRDSNGIVIAEIKMEYFLQEKEFDRLIFDPNTNAIIIEKFGSETSQALSVVLEKLVK